MVVDDKIAETEEEEEEEREEEKERIVISCDFKNLQVVYSTWHYHSDHR